MAAEPEPGRTVADLSALRELTGDERGAQRVAWTPTWARARDWLRERLAELPVDVDVDEAGNVWARLPGASARTVVLGSHVDSVPDGGWLDGALGVLAGLEVLRTFAARGEPPVGLALVDWADEEGARFGRSLLGSGLATGALDPAAVADDTDRDGIRLADALAEHGVTVDRAPAARDRLDGAAAYLELHIEQGPVLERLGLPVGVVTGTAGVERHRVRVHGQAVQGGAFPMDARHDALVAASRIVLAVRAAAGDERSRATVGDIRAHPGIPTAVPGECELIIDQRHPDAAELARMLDAVRAAGDAIAAEEGVGVEWERTWQIEPRPFDARLIEMAEAAARAETGGCERLFSGALHDAAAVAALGIPTVMLFVQSTAGISHHRDEDTPPEHLETAVRTLHRLTADVVARVADGAL